LETKAPLSNKQTSSKKIDLAITEEILESERTLVGIELKAINKSKEEIKNDAERMTKTMVSKDPIGENNIKFCFCGFLRRFDKNDKMVTGDYIESKTTEEKNLLSDLCSELGTIYSDLKFSFQIFDIVKDTLENVSKYHGSDSDYREVANDTGVVVGCILKIERK
jgi:S-adenosylmethionine:tRNA-ribosyltransferase-isomerase (queuine synthetase)